MKETSFKTVLCTLLCLFICITVSAQGKGEDLGKIVGSWSYSAPDAPYGYQDGTLEFKDEKGKLVARINIQGSVIEVRDIQAQGDTYTSSFYVDGNPVDLSITRKDKILEGTADTGGMVIPVTFKRAE